MSTCSRQRLSKPASDSRPGEEATEIQGTVRLPWRGTESSQESPADAAQLITMSAFSKGSSLLLMPRFRGQRGETR